MNPRLPQADKFLRFEQLILPHLDAAYNLARWLTRDENEATDAIQDASLCALRFIGGFRGGDGRIWLLAIVRNTCYSRLKQGTIRERETEFDDELHSPEIETANPEVLLERSRDNDVLQHALTLKPESDKEGEISELVAPHENYEEGGLRLGKLNPPQAVPARCLPHNSRGESWRNCPRNSAR
jgi:RNA polymerase sigma factor (sigma-70 family)